MSKTESIFNLIYSNLFTIKPVKALDYYGLQCAFVDLVEAIEKEPETDWSIGEFTECCLDDLIMGAYWFFADYHAGQYSTQYAALCVLGRIFKPNFSSLDQDAPEGDVYRMLEQFLTEEKKRAI